MAKPESGNNNIDEYEKTKYQTYLEERKLLIDAEREQSKSFDKYILTLASGALALSLSFMKLLNNIEPGTTCLIIASWLIFALSILSTLASFLTSQKACEKQRDTLDNNFLSDDKNDNNNENRLAILTEKLNWLSIITFFIAIILLISFAITNIKNYKGDTMAKKKIDEGYKPAKVPKKPNRKLEKGFKPPKAPKKK